jgi:3-phenylpropionate/trans-cinnamate dioxygenase ferredoxin component
VFERFKRENGVTTFTEVLDAEKLAPGRSTTVTVNGRRVALYNVGGQVYATDDACPHAGSSLGWGILEGKFIRCRAHGLRYDVTTGGALGNPEVCVKSYPAKIEGGKIYVSLVDRP